MYLARVTEHVVWASEKAHSRFFIVLPWESSCTYWPVPAGYRAFLVFRVYNTTIELGHFLFFFNIAFQLNWLQFVEKSDVVYMFVVGCVCGCPEVEPSTSYVCAGETFCIWTISPTSSKFKSLFNIGVRLVLGEGLKQARLPLNSPCSW